MRVLRVHEDHADDAMIARVSACLSAPLLELTSACSAVLVSDRVFLQVLACRL